MKDKHIKISHEDANPNPEYLIKSIAEQGYSLETSLADLIDNSISANADKIEVLIKTNEEPFVLFLADNGDGMNEVSLIRNMQFPSSSIDDIRVVGDMGRFGLGMKTASFAQTRCFTVISREKGTKEYNARTWDVSYLKENGWKIIINSKESTAELLSQYHQISNEYLNSFSDYSPNTIIVWKGLYKYQEYLDEYKRRDALKKEISESVSDHLSMVFHRFLERKRNKVSIRINNFFVEPFNPFPVSQPDFRPIEYKQKSIEKDYIKIEGFILPSRSIDEARKGNSIWTTAGKSLMDMEGMYVYRADRLIIYGGWNGIISKAPRLQLARLKVEVGNSVDHRLQLNVSKSRIVVPYDLRSSFYNYITYLKEQAEKEFYNRGIQKLISVKGAPKQMLFEKKPSNKGMLLEINPNFLILKNLRDSLNSSQRKEIDLIIKMVNTTINTLKQVHEDKCFTGNVDDDGISAADLEMMVRRLKSSGIQSKQIMDDILPALGFRIDTIPEKIMCLINE